jgi:uncharacterized membrane protein (DUF485 family)
MSIYDITAIVILPATNPAQVAVLMVLIVIALVAAVSLMVLMRFFKLWLQARLAHADVTFMELIGMWLRKTDYRAIVLSKITAVQMGLDLDVKDLESHYLAGGHVPRVVRALIAARRKGIELSWEDATAIDSDGRDVLAEVQSAADEADAVDSAEGPRADEPTELHFGDIGAAVSHLNPRGQARFGNATVDVVAEGLSIPEGSEVEVVESHGGRIVVRSVED